VPRVFVARAIPAAGLDLLRPHAELDVWPDCLPPPRAALLERVRGAGAVLSLLTDRIDAEVMDAAGPGLKVISNYAVGLDNVDLAEAARRGIPVGHTPGVLTESTADLAFALLLAAARRLPEGERAVKAGQWLTWEPTWMLGRDVASATLGIVGYGRIGRAVAARARGFRMRVLACGRTPIADPAGAQEVTMDELLARSDFVSLHAPLTDATRHLIRRETLARMKRGAILINTARGGLVDQDALAQALRDGHLAGAALDVTTPEPLPADHPLLQVPTCLVVPHVGSATIETRNRMAEIAARNALAGLRGEPLPAPAPGATAAPGTGTARRG
jgi:lactate dehydrogenase-like 2-hydroxyacid dehydrogenase